MQFEHQTEEEAARAVHTLANTYRSVFCNIFGEEVLRDFVEFSHFMDSGWSTDPLEMARACGRRDMLLRVLEFVKLSPYELFDLKRGQPIFIPEPEEE